MRDRWTQKNTEQPKQVCYPCKTAALAVFKPMYDFSGCIWEYMGVYRCLNTHQNMLKHFHNMGKSFTNTFWETNPHTSTSLHASMMRAYCSLLMTKPLISFFNLTGDCPSSLIRAVVLSATESVVQGAGITSTTGI